VKLKFYVILLIKIGIKETLSYNLSAKNKKDKEEFFLIPNNTKQLQQKVLKSHEYVKIAYKQDKKSIDFLKTCTIFNKNTGEIKKIEFNKDWHLRQTYLYNTFRIDYLNKECIDNNMIPIFLTITLPSKFHKTKKITINRKTKEFKLIPNKNYDSSCTVEDGYNELNRMFRDIYDNFRFDSKRTKLKFIRVIEPHASYTPHLHAVVYVNKNHVYKFIKHFVTIRKSNNLKQVDIKVLDTARYAVTYLLKYVDKTLRGDDNIRGWRIHHNIKRVLTMSNLGNGITRDVFKRVSAFIPFDKDDTRTYLSQILDKITINRTVLNADSTLKKFNSYEGNDSFITVDVSYKIKYKVNEITHDEEINLIEDMIYDDDYTCNLDYMKIVNNITKEVLYNKDDHLFYRGDIDVYRNYDNELCLLEYEDNNLITIGDLKNEY
jgi:hypothetical protein